MNKRNTGKTERPAGAAKKLLKKAGKPTAKAPAMRAEVRPAMASKPDAVQARLIRTIDALDQRLRVVEDIEAIKKLKALYCKYADGEIMGPTHDYDRFAELFVEDGVFIYEDLWNLVGREEIRRQIKDCQRIIFAFHRVTNAIIDVNGDTATGNWHVVVPMILPGDQATWVAGIYEEDYVRTTEGWRFKKLVFKPAFFTTYEQGWGRQRFLEGTPVDATPTA